MKLATTPNREPWCQLSGLPEMAGPMGTTKKLWQRRLRLKRILRHGASYARRALAEALGTRQRTGQSSPNLALAELMPGDLVRVRTRDEIERTLDTRGKLAHCGFMDEMWQYCGTTHRVYKRVEQFLDERDLRVHRVKHIVLLEGVICGGTRDYGRCDRACFFFWREEWLEKLEAAEE